jgi:hypothetical protein
VSKTALAIEAPAFPDAAGTETVETPASTEAPQTEADRLRAQARQCEADAYESFKRSGNDGFMSQWASGKMASLHRLEADLAEAGGRADFRGLFDLEGNLVRAVRFDGRWGWFWKLLDERGRCVGYFNESKAKSQERRVAANAKKGYYVGTVRVAARAELAGGNVSCVMPITVREDDGWSPDAEIIDNGQS